jgi:DTW domain-containing protein YfiP
MYDDELEVNESQEVKNQRRSRIEELTLQFLERGEKVQDIPTGKSAQKLYCKMSAKNKSASPSILIEGDAESYKNGQHPHSQFNIKKKPRSNSNEA